MDAVSGPILTAPSLRETKSFEQVRQYFRDDLAQVNQAAAQWVQQTAAREIANQLTLGNSKQYVQTVDGSQTKPLDQAQRKVQVIFALTLLARKLAQAQPILTAAIRRVTQVHSGLLTTGWEWYVQRGGKGGNTQRLGPTIPGDLTLATGDAMILAPRAPYAWFANYNAAREQAFVPAEIKRLRQGKVSRRQRAARLWFHGIRRSANAHRSVAHRRVSLAALLGALQQLGHEGALRRAGARVRCFQAIANSALRRPLC